LVTALRDSGGSGGCADDVPALPFGALPDVVPDALPFT
jgi:hypothetical protein